MGGKLDDETISLLSQEMFFRMRQHWAFVTIGADHAASEILKRMDEIEKILTEDANENLEEIVP